MLESSCGAVLVKYVALAPHCPSRACKLSTFRARNQPSCLKRDGPCICFPAGSWMRNLLDYSRQQPLLSRMICLHTRHVKETAEHLVKRITSYQLSRGYQSSWKIPLYHDVVIMPRVPWITISKIPTVSLGFYLNLHGTQVLWVFLFPSKVFFILSRQPFVVPLKFTRPKDRKFLAHC